MGYDRLMVSFTQIRINHARDYVVFHLMPVKLNSLSVSLLFLSCFPLLRLRAYNKCHISFQLLPIFSPVLCYRRRIWRRSLWGSRGAIERWIMAPIKADASDTLVFGINYFSDLSSRLSPVFKILWLVLARQARIFLR